MVSGGPSFAQGLNLVRQAVCEYQEPFIEYMFLASENHKLLKEHFRSRRLKRLRMRSSSYTDHLGELFTRLVGHLNTKLKRAFETTREYARSYYVLTSRNPRICLKSFYEGKVHDIFRARGDYQAPFPIEEHTGFAHIHMYGTSYRCSDIPGDAKRGLYKNPRLITHQVDQYKPPEVSLTDHVCDDPDWERCWKGVRGARPSPESCYKSSLIIPVAVRKSRLSGEFDRLFTQDTTVAYLCFDHRCTNYFRQEDEDIGFIFADILSLYMINRLIYTSNSHTFRDVRKELGVVWDPCEIIHSAHPNSI